jgi:hypothetical protein
MKTTGKSIDLIGIIEKFIYTNGMQEMAELRKISEVILTNSPV